MGVTHPKAALGNTFPKMARDALRISLCDFLTPPARLEPRTSARCLNREKETLPLGAKVSLRRMMKQDVLITTLIITSTLEVAGKGISWQVTEVIKLEGEVTDP